jgi:hypothetical protein
MKTPPSDSDQRWETLLKQARSDVGPPTDVPALLRVLHQPAVVARENWTTELAALFPTGRIFSGCLAGAAAFALIATWQVWDSWQDLPWVQLIDVTTGGAS